MVKKLEIILYMEQMKDIYLIEEKYIYLIEENMKGYPK